MSLLVNTSASETRSVAWACGWFFIVVTAFGHINKVKLYQAQLVLELMTTFGGYTIQVFSRCSQPGQ